MGTEELWQIPATRLAVMIRAREVSPVEVVEAVVTRISQFNYMLNAYVDVHADRALAQARAAEAAIVAGEPLGPLHGLPVSIKDNIWYKGDVAASGSRVLKDFIATADSPTVLRLRAAGAIVIGRTSMPEFAWRGTTDNPLHGECSNPWDTSMTAGGSSGGAAAAVAGGMGPLSVGSDGAGSIRIPASFCGIVGLKPTFGHVAHYPALGGSELLAHVGPMTRTVDDCGLLYRAIRGYDRRDPLSTLDPSRGEDTLLAGTSGLRVAWAAHLADVPVEHEVLEIVTRAVRALSGLVLTVEEATPNLDSIGELLDTLYGVAQAGGHASRPAEQKALMDPELVAYAEAHQGISGVDYVAAVKLRQQNVAILNEFFTEFDLLLTPTVGLPAFGLGAVNPSAVAGRNVGHLAWAPCYPFNFSGQPAISVPAGQTTQGLPVGLQIVGRRHEDATVLALAAAFERLQPWADRWPPMQLAIDRDPTFSDSEIVARAEGE
ncbi:amidase [Pseudonocardia kujensis]|uniref:amidase n=1 Tax=Pseudonocardia kujensis TaxID=1128675 RepID=UPI001E3815E2|nr:amidase family protein [Pseudonocardia kujensis]MCE0764968.1 amidase [Pseudonocardia kujensis]